ncbi:hypothetical protein QE152_g38842 [Popillia japonica]|uniref:Ribosomal protein S7 n=1 Tax=Popillia japonica TaxID=7064 RepID=A0AAW1HVL0_POPJA
MGRFYKSKHNRVPISEEIIKRAIREVIRVPISEEIIKRAIREVIRDKKSIRVTAAKNIIVFQFRRKSSKGRLGKLSEIRRVFGLLPQNML